MAVVSFKRSLYTSNPDKYISFLAGNEAFDPGAFVPIANTAGTGSATTITFSGIPSTYKNLQLRFIGKSTTTSGAVTTFRVTFNSSSSNYAWHRLSGDGATASASAGADAAQIISSAVVPTSNAVLASMMSVSIIDIDDYTSTSKNKTVRMFNGSDLNRTATPVGVVALNSGLWFDTPVAINSITLTLQSGNWTTSSIFSLYGIKGA
jgi:hypothetical protein